MKKFLKYFLLSITGFVLLIVLAVSFAEDKPVEAKKKDAPAKPTASTEENARLIAEENAKAVSENLSYARGFINNYTATNRISIIAVEAEAKRFAPNYGFVKDVLLNGTEAEKKEAEALKKKLSKIQAKEFPALRKKYADHARKTMWEHNVDVKIGGNKSDVLYMTAGAFANNGNIKEVHETIAEMLHTLRFKKVHYRWYKDQTDNYYFTLDTYPDSQVSENLYKQQ